MDDLSEKEQIEAIRTWWKENGRFVIGGIVLGVALLFGWNYWNGRQREAQLGASALYESLVGEVADADVASAEEISEKLKSDYPSTVYVSQAQLAMARMYMDVGRDEDAAAALRELLDSGDDPDVALIARLRLGKVLLYQGKSEEVVKLLQDYRDTSFGARYNETLGDAYVALGKTDDASEAYTAALADNPGTPTVDRTLIQMKIYDLPHAGASAAEKADTPDDQGTAAEGAREALPAGNAPETATGGTSEASPPAGDEAGGESADEPPPPGETE